MPWQLVGVTSAVGTSSGYTVSLAGTLTGGIASSPAAGDLVIVMTAFGNTASSAPAVSGNNSGAYNAIATPVHANDTWDTEAQPFWEVMGATPDTTLTITRVTNTAYGGATAVQVWRGVDQASPFIGAAAAASGANGCVIDPPAYNPAVAGALIVAAGAGTMAATSSDYTGFTGMSNFLTRKGDGSTSDCAVVMATFEYAGASYDPAAVSGGTTSTSSSWAGFTFAFRTYAAPTLALSDAAHGHAADSLALVTGSNLAVQEASHAHGADALLLAVQSAANLAVQEAAHGHGADSLTLVPASSTLLAIAEALHAHLGDAVALSTLTGLTVADGGHAHQADALTLGVTTALALVVAEALHAHAADGLVLGGASVAALQIADAGHVHAVDAVALASQIALAVDEALSGHGAGEVTLAIELDLSVAFGVHAHLADEVPLNTLVIEVVVQAPAGAGPVPRPADGRRPLPVSSVRVSVVAGRRVGSTTSSRPASSGGRRLH